MILLYTKKTMNIVSHILHRYIKRYFQNSVALRKPKETTALSTVQLFLLDGALVLGKINKTRGKVSRSRIL